MTRYELHVSSWRGCTQCELHEHRKKVVLARGDVPADIVFVGEAPGQCITGDTLIDTAFRDKSKHPHGIPIKDMIGKPGQLVYSYDIDNHKVAIDRVVKVWKTGIKRVYKVTFSWWGGKPDGSGGRHKYFGSIKVTANHPFLLINNLYQSIELGLKRGSRLHPFYRRPYEYQQVGDSAATLRLESNLLMEYVIGRPLDKWEEVHHDDRNKWNDTRKNLVLTDKVEHARLHALEDNVMFDHEHRENHAKAMSSIEYRSNMSSVMKQVFASEEMRKKRSEQNRRVAHKTSASVKHRFATDPCYYYNYLVGRKFRDGSRLTTERIREKFVDKFPGVEFPPVENHVVESIEDAGMQTVYDMQTAEHHNFVANGVFVHNSEDVLGRPFVGPAGKLLDYIVKEAMPLEYADGEYNPPTGPKYTIAYTNLVACIPLDEDHIKTAEPSKECIRACESRLIEFVRMCQPKLIVVVGALAKKHVMGQAMFSVHEDYSLEWLDPGKFLHFVEITHPAAIIRSNVAQQGLAIQRCVVKLRNAIHECFESQPVATPVAKFSCSRPQPGTRR